MFYKNIGNFPYIYIFYQIYQSENLIDFVNTIQKQFFNNGVILNDAHYFKHYLISIWKGTKISKNRIITFIIVKEKDYAYQFHFFTILK